LLKPIFAASKPPLIGKDFSVIPAKAVNPSIRFMKRNVLLSQE
jgi:hypothetical protein